MMRRASREFMEGIPEHRGAWYETPAEIEQQLEWGKRKAELMRWVRRQMERRLTPRERRCLELYYFENLNYEQVGRATNTHCSCAWRAVRRALDKLRAAAQQDTSWMDDKAEK